jgi:CarD family transcriptional regulator
MLEKGSYVIYGTTGVCIVQNIAPLDMKGASAERLYYVLEPCFHKGNTIFTPVDSGKVPLRAIMSREEAQSLIAEIPKIEEFWENNDKVREQKYKEKIRGCDPREWIRIIKTTYMRQQQRLSMGKKMTSLDERYGKAAEEYLYSELAISLNRSRDEVKKKIKEQIEELQYDKITTV